MHPGALMQVSLLTYGMLAARALDLAPQQVGVNEPASSVDSGSWYAHGRPRDCSAKTVGASGVACYNANNAR